MFGPLLQGAAALQAGGAPVLSAASIFGVTSKGGFPRVTISGVATYTTYYVAYASGGATPTGAQIVAGQNASGVAALASGSQAFGALGVETFSTAITTLTASTAYIVAYVDFDGAASYSNIVTYVFSTVSASVAGSAAITQAPNTSTASGSVAISGSATDTQQANTTTASGSVLVSGSAAVTQQPNTTTASGTVAIAGSAAVTQQPNLATASGTVASGIAGGAAITQAPNTTTASGAVAIAGSAAVGQQPNTTTAAGAVLVSGAAAATQQPNTVSASGLVLSAIAGSAALIQQPNFVTSSGAIIIPTAGLAGRTTEGVGGGGGGGGHHGTLGGLIQFDTKRSPSKDKKSPTAKALSADNSMRAQIERSNADILHIVMVATHTGALDG